MKTKADVIAKLKQLGACEEAQAFVAASKKKTAKAIWSEIPRGDWLLWVAGRVGVDLKLLVLAACKCARTALKYAPKGDERPRIAIETAERWTRGKATFEEVGNAAYAADAGEAAFSAAYAAAHAANAAAHAAADAAKEKGRQATANLVRQTISWDDLKEALS